VIHCAARNAKIDICHCEAALWPKQSPPVSLVAAALGGEAIPTVLERALGIAAAESQCTLPLPAASAGTQ